MLDTIINLIGTALCYGLAILLVALVLFFFVCCEKEKKEGE